MSTSSFPYGVIAAPAGGGVVTLSGEFVLAFSFGSQATGELFFQTDGTVDRRVNFGSLVQIDSGTDWIIPNGDASTAYQFRFTNRSGPAYDFASAAEDTWRANTTAYELQQLDNSPFSGGNVTTSDVEVRLGTGSTLASASYTIDADREDF